MPRRIDYTWRDGTLDSIVSRVKELHEIGGDVSFTYMGKTRGETQALYGDAKNKFKVSWTKVLELAGLQEAAKQMDFPWKTFDDAVNQVKELHKSGRPVSTQHIRKQGTREEKRLLDFVARVLRRKWSDVLEKANLRGQAERKKFPWQRNLKKIVARIRELHLQGVPVTAAYGRYGDHPELSSMFGHFANLKRGKKKVATWTDLVRMAGIKSTSRVDRSYRWYGKRDLALQRVRELAKPGQKLNTNTIKRGEFKSLYDHFVTKLNMPWHDVLALTENNPFEHTSKPNDIGITNAIQEFLHGFVRQKLIVEGNPVVEYHWRKNYRREFAALRRWEVNGVPFGGHGTFFEYAKGHHDWPFSRSKYVDLHSRGLE